MANTVKGGQSPGGKGIDHLDSDDQLADDKAIRSDEDLHQAQAGNIGEQDAKKDQLDGPAIDLVGQPSDKDH